jgi:hypothetical protein
MKTIKLLPHLAIHQQEKIALLLKLKAAIKLLKTTTEYEVLQSFRDKVAIIENLKNK